MYLHSALFGLMISPLPRARVGQWVHMHNVASLDREAALTRVSPRARSNRVSMSAADPASPEARADVLFVVPDRETLSPFGATSPLPSPPWAAVATQLAARLPNLDERIRARVVTQAELLDSPVPADVIIALAVNDAAALERASASAKPAAVVCHACSAEASLVGYAGAFAARDASAPLGRLLRAVAPWGAQASGERFFSSAQKLLGRLSSEDALFAVLLLLHRLGVLDIAVVRSDINPSWEKGPLRNAREFAQMVRCCGPQIFAAISDPVSKQAIDLLNAVDLRDQVGSYRVIVSYETPLLEDFSLCILQQNNCFGCDAPILTKPEVPLLKAWRGRPLDAQAASEIFVGHLDHPAASAAASRLPWSWKVVCGANPAYDSFPQQHQIFYPTGAGAGAGADEASSAAGAAGGGGGKGALWYDPVFLVETIDNRLIWCKRHYRCTPRKVRGQSAGAWTFSTLDNGIVSLEHWSTVDVADDLSWAVFHYSGAARRAGQSYQGALLCSADGLWPAHAREGPEFERVRSALRKCGLELWELYGHGPPLLDTAGPDGAQQAGRSFMWTSRHAEWAAANPPPLEPIGDISITSWRQQERARLAAAPGAAPAAGGGSS